MVVAGREKGNALRVDALQFTWEPLAMSAPEPVLSCEQIRAVDRLALEEYGIPGVCLMENAGAGATRMLLEREPRSVAILCGPGNNGGDGHVVARHLANAGVEVRVLEFAAPERLRGDAAVMREIVSRMAGSDPASLRMASGLDREPVSLRDELRGCDWIVDGLLGTGFSGQVREPLAGAIRLCNELRAQGAKVLALDLPSGLDTDSGEAATDTVRADLTVTFAARKHGLLKPGAAQFIGLVQVASIGAPTELLQRVLREV